MKWLPAWLLSVLSAAAVAVAAGGGAGANDGRRTWDFSKDKPGERPAGFTFAATGRGEAGPWRVVDDSGNHVLAQLGRGGDKNRMTLAVADHPAPGDVRLSARIKVVGGEAEEVGGIVWRYQNPSNYLCARLDTDEDNVLLYRVVNGNRVKFGGEGDLRLKEKTWYTLRIEHRGERIKVYLDDEMLFDERDQHFKTPGSVGLWTKGDSHVYFDELRAAPLEPRGGRGQNDDDNGDDDDRK